MQALNAWLMDESRLMHWIGGRSPSEVRRLLDVAGKAARQVREVPASHLARATDWFGRLTSGQAQSVSEIAQAEGVTNAYVIRVTDLAVLAPDILQSTKRGDHPPALNAERPIHLVPLPMDWSEQRALLGFDR